MSSGFRNSVALVPWLLAAALVLGGYIWHRSEELPGFGRVHTIGTVRIGGPFALVDQNGARKTEQDFRGHYLLVFFGYTTCPDVCPTLLGVMQDALARLGPRAADITPVFITVDPGRDTPGVLKNYLAAFGPRFVGLTGTMDEVKRAASAYGVGFTKHPLANGDYGVDHSSVIYLMGKDGKFITYYDEDTGPDAMAEDLRKRL